MTRAELTYDKMVDTGWKSFFEGERVRVEDKVTTSVPLEEVVSNIKDYTYKFLRCSDDGYTYIEDDFGMCSTYRVYMKKEFLEVSDDNINWVLVAHRMVETYRYCIYAD